MKCTGLVPYLIFVRLGIRKIKTYAPHVTRFTNHIAVVCGYTLSVARSARFWWKDLHRLFFVFFRSYSTPPPWIWWITHNDSVFCRVNSSENKRKRDSIYAMSAIPIPTARNVAAASHIIEHSLKRRCSQPLYTLYSI